MIMIMQILIAANNSSKENAQVSIFMFLLYKGFIDYDNADIDYGQQFIKRQWKSKHFVCPYCIDQFVPP